MEPHNNAPRPLVDITESRSYILKLIRPKDDKIAQRFKMNAAGYASCRLFFLDGDGNCLTKNFTAQWPKGLAMLVGKMTGQYCPAPPENITVENLFRFVEPAFGKKATFHIEVTENGEWQGKPQYRYKFTKIEPIADRAVYPPTQSDQGEPLNDDKIAPNREWGGDVQF